MGLVLAGAGLGAMPAFAAASGTPVPAGNPCAAAGTCSYVVKHAAPGGGDFPLLNGMNGPNDLDEALIDYDIYIPENATAATPQPAVMYFNGFGGAKDDSSGVALGKFLAGHGYVVMPFSSEGFGNSKHKIELDSPEFDVKNAEALVTLLASKDYVFKDAAGDPRVGTTGGSYGGAIQIMLAEFDPRIDASLAEAFDDAIRNRADMPV